MRLLQQVRYNPFHEKIFEVQNGNQGEPESLVFLSSEFTGEDLADFSNFICQTVASLADDNIMAHFVEYWEAKVCELAACLLLAVKKMDEANFPAGCFNSLQQIYFSNILQPVPTLARLLESSNSFVSEKYPLNAYSKAAVGKIIALLLPSNLTFSEQACSFIQLISNPVSWHQIIRHAWVNGKDFEQLHWYRKWPQSNMQLQCLEEETLTKLMEKKNLPSVSTGETLES
ncbi:hypothetical protein BCR33DRAFT_720827 [Rhizoclosmatium globosum]|uniref:Uncharacterized protein n=1 Tax=Rhizoclosmatium globosum TaxID=329046 RepID=A0A1Y2BUK7_9FUNG|nr:hypothetical protein BCR33DRAFT_720827 [Rhizoclosmatium globosum]|eukprot:ORY38458.1 hypothetical protein BCR33DRAFT_720827 [Rhizoclosmatium globosum]